jgi:hypothetical protein
MPAPHPSPKPARSSSLAATVEELLATVQVPLATGSVRVLASVLRHETSGETSAERLGRIAAYERENFLKTRVPPRLCSAILPDGTAPARRVWARGDWRLARRIITRDVVETWSAAVGTFVCDLILDEKIEDSRLGPLAYELASQSIGPVAAYYPETGDQWRDLRSAFRRMIPALGLAAHTREQGDAEAALTRAELSPVSVYFGLEAPVGIVRDIAPPKRLRLALPAERSVAFDEYVSSRLGGDVDATRDLLAYIQEFGHIMDDTGRVPSLPEYADRWHVDLEAARDRNRRFKEVFADEEDPAAIWRMLWDGTSSSSFARLTGVHVVEDAGFPSVTSYFVSSVVIELHESVAGAAVSKAYRAADGALDAPRELRRFFALCSRAVEVWCADSLKRKGDEASLMGLRSLGGIIEEADAAVVQENLGKYRLDSATSEGNDVLLATQKALRVAAALSALLPPGTTRPYLDGVRWAAKALVAAQNELGLDIVAEVATTVNRLDAVL